MGATDHRRYKGTSPFLDQEVDRKTFFGRDHEKRSLLSLILAEDLVVVFAKSGMGKSSLINAGIAEPLRQRRYFPIITRLNDQKRGPVGSMLDGIRRAADEAGVDRVGGTDDETSAWRLFRTTEFWSKDDELLRPVLILDQFEELFTLHGPEQRTGFIAQLTELVRGRAEPDGELGRERPELKIVLSLREDFLANLEELAGAIPGILHNRFRLGPLRKDAARDAIVRPAGLDDERFETARFSYREDAIDRILEFLGKHRKDGDVVQADEVEPVQLQLLCQYVETDIIARQAGQGDGGTIEVSESDLGDERHMQLVLEDFYDRTIRSIARGRERRAARRLCESLLISPGGRRRTEDGEEIGRVLGLSPERLRALVDARLLRAEPRLGGTFYELSHDTLVEPIRQSRARRRMRRVKWAGGFVGLVGIVALGFAYSGSDGSSAPQLNIVTPRWNAQVQPGGLTILGTVREKSPPYMVQIVVKDSTFDAKVDGDNWEAEVHIPSQEGELRLAAVAKDHLGEESERLVQTVEVVDSHPPQLEIVTPPRNARVHPGKLAIEGTVRDLSAPCTVQVVVNDKSFGVTVKREKWSVEVDIPEEDGTLELAASGKDRYGNVSELLRHPVKVVIERKVQEFDGFTFSGTNRRTSLPEYEHKQTGIRFVLLPGGSFTMGSPRSERGRDKGEGPQHVVTLGAFLIATHEVTQEQWQKVMNANPSKFTGDDRRPVEQVSWNDCQDFCKKTGLRLPSEAEWEYACRAGTNTAYSFGSDPARLGESAWYDSNSNYTTHPVGTKEPNPWGLFDMHGNVWEWCEDEWHDNYNDAPTDGSAWLGGASGRVMRGGSLRDPARNCRSAYRLRIHPDARNLNVGFRPARSLLP